MNLALIDDLNLETIDEVRESHSQFDHVTTWKAPYTGVISISGNVELTNANTCQNTNNTNDFRLWIEQASEGQTTVATVLPTSTRTLSASSPTASYNLTSISVQKGDFLYREGDPVEISIF